MTESIERAYQDGKIGRMQYDAINKHAQKHSEEHIERMLAVMRHITFAKAHKEAMKES